MIFYSIVLLFLAAFFWYKMKIRKFEKFARALPGDLAYTPMGNLETILFILNLDAVEIVKWLDGLNRNHQKEGIMKFWIIHFFSVVIWRHDYVKEVGTNPFTARKGKILWYLLGDVVNGVFVNEGTPAVKDLRKPILQMMKKKHLESWHHSGFLKHSREFVERLKSTLNEKEVNIRDEVLRVSFDMFADTSVGVNASAGLKTTSPSPLHIVYKFINDRAIYSFKIWPYFVRWMYTTKNRDGLEQMYDYMSRIINYRKEEMKEGVAEDGDFEYFTDAMIKVGKDKNMNDMELTKELLEGVIAGGATTSIVLSSLLVFLAIHSDVQEQVYQEQLEIFGDEVTRDPRPEDLPRMVLLGRVVKETLRLVSAPFIHKQATADLKLGRYDIPKDTYVMVLIRQLHRDPDHWERPQEFFPDHFLPERVQARPDTAYIPFGLGMRRCPGESYALASLTTAASVLVRNYKFSSKWAPQDLLYEFNLICGFQHKFYDVLIEERRLLDKSPCEIAATSR